MADILKNNNKTMKDLFSKKTKETVKVPQALPEGGPYEVTFQKVEVDQENLTFIIHFSYEGEDYKLLESPLKKPNKVKDKELTEEDKVNWSFNNILKIAEQLGITKEFKIEDLNSYKGTFKVWAKKSQTVGKTYYNVTGPPASAPTSSETVEKEDF